MLILGIESSCDETGASIIEGNKGSKKVKLLSNVLASSVALHAKTGGIIPESAAREQVKFIIPVIKKAIEEAGIKPNKLDAIAVTNGPGLVGSLLIGVETAKMLSYVWNKQLIPVNHLIGHIYANFIESNLSPSPFTLNTKIDFPAIALIVSGGHTDLVLIKHHGNIEWLGGTRDDAAGEALDKIGRLLSLPYPGGPHIEQASERGDASRFTFPSPLINSKDFDFSFSGLKTAVLREVERGVTGVEGLPTARRETSRERALAGRKRVAGPRAIVQLNNRIICDLSASVQKAIIDVLVKKTLNAARKFSAKSILLGGGVAANSKLREQFEWSIVNGQLSNVKLFVPPKSLCTDNAAMIATAAYFDHQTQPWQKIDAVPNLYFT